MQRQLTHVMGEDLPSSSFLTFVGCHAYYSKIAVHYIRPTHDHVFLWVNEPGSGKMYECALHTELTYTSQMQVCLFTEPCPVADWPKFGFDVETELSYRRLGLKQFDFHTLEKRSLGEEIHGLAGHSDRIQVYGFAHMDGSGIHDIHQNSGERPHVTRAEQTDKDGCLVFYYSDIEGIPAHRVWLCMKFENQNL